MTMRAFEAMVNGKQLCTAGTRDGALAVTITDVSDDTTLYIGASDSTSGESITWINTSLKSGDEVRLRVIECESVDKPAERHLPRT
jgi:hypothetical protein